MRNNKVQPQTKRHTETKLQEKVPFFARRLTRGRLVVKTGIQAGANEPGLGLLY